jgi:ribosomal protein S18 acetylase RimI-like enzyme
VYIDISGLPPARLLDYFPSMVRNSRKFLFGSDFPGVPGIRKNCRAIARLVADEEALQNISFQNAYDLFGFWKEGLFEVREPEEIAGVVNDGARRCRGAMTDEQWHEPYMPMEEVLTEMKRMRFYGYRKELELMAVMAEERVLDATLMRHAYVSMNCQGKGIGSKLLGLLERQVQTEWLLVGIRKAATWAVGFYQKHGYELMKNKDELFRRYWEIPERQIETSVVLGKRMRPASS